MYSLKEPLCIELKNKIEEFGRIKSKEEQIISAIQFVQNEIRYLEWKMVLTPINHILIIR